MLTAKVLGIHACRLVSWTNALLGRVERISQMLQASAYMMAISAPASGIVTTKLDVAHVGLRLSCPIVTFDARGP